MLLFFASARATPRGAGGDVPLVHRADRQLGAVGVAGIDAGGPAAVGPAEYSIPLFFGCAILFGDRRRNLANSVSALVDAGLARGLRKLVAEALFGERSAAGAAYLKSGRRLDRRPA